MESEVLVFLVGKALFLDIVTELGLFYFKRLEFFLLDVGFFLEALLLFFFFLMFLVGDFVELSRWRGTSFSMRSYALKEQEGLSSSMRDLRKASLQVDLKLLLRSFSATTHAKNL